MIRSVLADYEELDYKNSGKDTRVVFRSTEKSNFTRISFQNVVANSTTANITIDLAPGQVLDPHVLMNVRLQYVITKTTNTDTINVGLRSWPLNRLIQSATISCGSATENVTTPSIYIPCLDYLRSDPSYVNSGNSSSACQPSQYATTGNGNPVLSNANTTQLSKFVYQPNSCQLTRLESQTSGGNVAQVVVAEFTISEYLRLPFLEACDQYNARCISSVSQITISLNFENLNSILLVSGTAVPASITSSFLVDPVPSLDVTFLQPYRDVSLLRNIISKNGGQLIRYLSFIDNVSQAQTIASETLSSVFSLPSISRSTMPKYLMLYCTYTKPSSLFSANPAGATQCDQLIPLTSVQLSINNQIILNGSESQCLLYKISKKAGYAFSYEHFSGMRPMSNIGGGTIPLAVRGNSSSIPTPPAPIANTVNAPIDGLQSCVLFVPLSYVGSSVPSESVNNCNISITAAYAFNNTGAQMVGTVLHMTTAEVRYLHIDEFGGSRVIVSGLSQQELEKLDYATPQMVQEYMSQECRPFISGGSFLSDFADGFKKGFSSVVKPAVDIVSKHPELLGLGKKMGGKFKPL